MKRFTVLAAILSAFLVVAGLTGEPRADSGNENIILSDDDYDYDYHFEPVSWDHDKLQVSISFTFSPVRGDCDSVKVSPYELGGIQFSRPDPWWAQLDKNGSYSTVLELRLPPHDTSKIGIKLECPRAFAWPSYYFVTTNDTIEFYYGHPKAVALANYKRQEEPGLGKRLPGEFPHLDSLFGVPKVDSVISHGKGTYGNLAERRGPRSSGKINLEEMRKLEKEPLTEKDLQIVFVDGINYQRRRGEYKFKEIEYIEDRAAYQRSRREAKKDNAPCLEREFIVDLRDPDHLEFARSLIDSLTPTDSAGFYRGFITIDVRDSLRKKGIIIYKSRNIPRRDRNEMTDPITH